MSYIFENMISVIKHELQYIFFGWSSSSIVSYFMCSQIPFDPSIDIDTIYLPQKSVCLATSRFIQKKEGHPKVIQGVLELSKTKILNFFTKESIGLPPKKRLAKFFFQKGTMSSEFFMFRTLFLAFAFKP